MPEKRLAWGTRGLVAGWIGQSGVLVPWDVTAVAAQGFIGTFLPIVTWPSISINSKFKVMYLIILVSNKDPYDTVSKND